MNKTFSLICIPILCVLMGGCNKNDFFDNKIRLIEGIYKDETVYEMSIKKGATLEIKEGNGHIETFDINGCENICTLILENSAESNSVEMSISNDDLVFHKKLDLNNLVGNGFNYYGNSNWVSVENNNKETSIVIFYTSQDNTSDFTYFMERAKEEEVKNSSNSYIILKVKR